MPDETPAQPAPKPPAERVIVGYRPGYIDVVVPDGQPGLDGVLRSSNRHVQGLVPIFADEVPPTPTDNA